MKNKNGFISMTLVYSFLIVFLFLLLAILKIYSENNKFLMTIDEMVNNDLESIRLTRSNLITIILQDNVPFNSDRIDLNAIAGGDIGNGNGLYYTDDSSITDENNDGLTNRIYYFRGNVLNNYVLVKNNNTCWRILRTNEDGSIRMVYYGEAENDQCPTPSAIKDRENNVISTEYNKNSYDDGENKKYVGYMFGFNKNEYYDDETLVVCHDSPRCESTVKRELDLWYEREFHDKKLNSLLANAIFCTNREGEGTGNVWSFRKVKTRSFRCVNEEDRITLSRFSPVHGGYSDIANSLYYPIGLLTAPDVYFAGGDTDTFNSDYYLNYLENAWTMTPYGMNSGNAQVLRVEKASGKKNKLTPTNVTQYNVNPTEKILLYPVISLKSTVKVLGGSGLFANPYVVGVEEEEGEGNE